MFTCLWVSGASGHLAPRPRPPHGRGLPRLQAGGRAPPFPPTMQPVHPAPIPPAPPRPYGPQEIKPFFIFNRVGRPRGLALRYFFVIFHRKNLSLRV